MGESASGQGPDMKNDARFAPILADLETISRELQEEGFLKTLTGTDGASVTIEFGVWGEEGEAEPSVIVSIDSPEDFEGEDDLLDDFEAEVLERLEAASRGWSTEATDLLGDDRQVVLLFNGEDV
ncbi:hypothetical protein [Chlorobium sp. N1]|uniref:hypothetical protein n=1 Tax=Chlorobium sp. N1 TaxID=2491138 RepID=UPI00103AC930|nr:hypothetical protein [Chlorobium sp. N1]TCD48269.1 hypothetical protein E0L29_05165 [Chlorobium sp. N1]